MRPAVPRREWRARTGCRRRARGVSFAFMRRIAQLLLLLAFAFSQAAAVECPMASAPASARAHAMHHGMPADAPHPAPRHAHDPAQHAECGLAMSCGAAAIVALETIAPAVSIRPDAPARVPALYASPFIATASPPPRPALPA